MRTEANVVTVTIRDGEAVGRGEGVPYTRYGETVEGALDAVEGARGLIEAGGGREELRMAMPAGAARNAVDCALWDLEARLTGRTVAERLGAPPPPSSDGFIPAGAWAAPPAPGLIASALTIVIDAPEAMAVAARAVAGAPLIKIKLHADEPAARIRAVRAAAPGAALIVDPNESWDRAMMEAMRPVLVEAGVALLEQPVPAVDDAWLEDFGSAVPICADEAIHTRADLDAVSRRYQAVNVKLDKTGGLTEAIELAREARARGLGLMTGCMVCSSLSIAPALHIARMSDFADLDGPLWLREDRAGGVRDEGGLLHPPGRGFWGEP